MDTNSNNRLFLNFANTDKMATSQDRTYPTTPSTFPQPVFGNAMQPSSGLQAPQGQQYNSGFGAQGYFMQNQATNQYSSQAQMNDYVGAQKAGAYQGRMNNAAINDPNVGLAHQFSHQNLGGAARGGVGMQGVGSSNAYGDSARVGTSAAQRPRTAGAPTGQQPTFGSYLNAPMPTQSAGGAMSPDFQPAPERNPDKYGPNANNNQKKCSQLAADFFKDSVKRARERNQR